MTANGRAPRGMNDTEAALYWATKSWSLPEDVADKTGLSEAECLTIKAEIKRVRKLHQESTEPLFQSLNGITRPLSRELKWIDGRTVDEAAFDKYSEWLKRAKVGATFQGMQAVFGEGPGAQIDIFTCTRIA